MAGPDRRDLNACSMPEAEPARTSQDNANRAKLHVAAWLNNSAAEAQKIGYCREDAANAPGARARIVRAHRISCCHIAAGDASGTVAAVTISARPTFRPSARTR